MKLDPTQQVYTTPVDSIFIADERQRRAYSIKKLNSLMESMKEVGQLSPGLCFNNPEGKLQLIFGWRRLNACKLLDKPFSYILREEVKDPYMLELMELEENLQREDLAWQDEVHAKERLHEIYQSLYGKTRPGARGGHSIADTATSLGEGKSILQEDLQLAKFAHHVPEVAAAPNKTTAKKIVARLLATVKRDEKLETSLAAKQDDLELIAKAAGIPTSEVNSREFRLLEFDRRCLLGRLEDQLPALQPESFDIVLFDPPWRVGLDTVSKKDGSKKDYDDEKKPSKTFAEELFDWLTLIYSRMKPDSHLYMFFGIVNHELAYSVLDEVGFTTNRMPLIWYKKGSHTTRNPDVWPGRSYEPIAFARKGSKALVLKGKEDIIQTSLVPKRLADIHPSAKHPDVYRDLLLRSASPGDLVLDPMAGSGSSLVAADSLEADLSLDWYGIELDKDFRNLELINLDLGYWALTGSQSSIQATPLPPDESFKNLSPGSEEWATFWHANPHMQEAMLIFLKEGK